MMVVKDQLVVPQILIMMTMIYIIMVHTNIL